MTMFAQLGKTSVRINSSKLFKAGRKALRYLNGENPLKAKIPYIFMTNSGGMSEEQKADELTRNMGVNVSPEQANPSLLSRKFSAVMMFHDSYDCKVAFLMIL
ncbi:hypothetical protein AYI68_g3790 [Smittium mucronatum]|uniref:Uncharacterized protein n=1 Tax=Smittium mucronatum TaxID=133383 RepID=A0A1R0GYX0_9FUNG|nr:hypothetical protein AYI68_g3790 [Smittium mucronatum]